MGNDREGGRKINKLSSAGQLKCEGGGDRRHWGTVKSPVGKLEKCYDRIKHRVTSGDVTQ